MAFVTNNSADFWTIARRGVEKADAGAGGRRSRVQAHRRRHRRRTAAHRRRPADQRRGRHRHLAGRSAEPDRADRRGREAGAGVHPGQRRPAVGAHLLYRHRQPGGRAPGRPAHPRGASPRAAAIMLFVGRLDARNAQERVQGIKEALAGSNIRILDVRTDDADDVRAKANAADTLVRYPDVKGLVGLWSYNGPAILNAVREAGKDGPRADHRVRRSRRDAGRHQGRRTSTPPSSSSRTSSAIRRSRGWRRRCAATARSSPRRKQIIVPTLVVEPHERRRVHAAHQHIAGAIDGRR